MTDQPQGVRAKPLWQLSLEEYLSRQPPSKLAQRGSWHVHCAAVARALVEGEEVPAEIVNSYSPQVLAQKRLELRAVHGDLHAQKELRAQALAEGRKTTEYALVYVMAAPQLYEWPPVGPVGGAIRKEEKRWIAE